MQQLIPGGYYDLLNATVTEYNTLSGGYLWTDSTNKQKRYQIISTDGVIKELKFKLTGSPGAGKKYTFTFYLNGNPTALTFEIKDLETTGGLVHDIDVTGGDYVCIESDPDNSPTPRYATWSSIFEGDNPKESLILGVTPTNLSNTTTEYGQLATSACSFGSTEDEYRQICPTNGTLKKLYVKLSEGPGSIAEAYRFTIRVGKNNPLNGLVVTITDPSVTGNDLVHTIDVSAGQVLTWKIEPLNTPSATPYLCWGLTFEADIDGESIMLGGVYDLLPTLTTEYNRLQIGLYSSSWNSTEAERRQLGQRCILKKLYILLDGNPGGGAKYDLTVRAGGQPSNVIATIAEAATTGNSGVLEDIVLDNEYISLECDPTGIVTPRNAYWGLVSYIMPIHFLDLPSKFELQKTATLKGIITIRQASSIILKGIFTVRKSSSAALKGIIAIRHMATEDLYAKFEAQAVKDLYAKFEAQATAALKGIFETAQWEDLKGIFIARQSSSAALKGILVIRHSSSAALKAVFHRKTLWAGTPQNLKAVFSVKQDAEDLYARFEVQATAFLLCYFHVGQDAEDLYTDFEVAHWLNLYAKFNTVATAQLKGLFIVRHVSSNTVFAKLEITQWEGLYAKFETVATAQLKGFFVVKCCNFIDIPSEFRITREKWDMQGIDDEVLEALGIIS